MSARALSREASSIGSYGEEFLQDCVRIVTDLFRLKGRITLEERSRMPNNKEQGAGKSRTMCIGTNGITQRPV